MATETRKRTNASRQASPKKPTQAKSSNTGGKSHNTTKDSTAVQRRKSQKTDNGSKTSDTKLNVSTEEKRADTTLRDEIVIILALLFSALLMLSYFNLCGIFGTWLNTVVFGLIGSFGYVFPVVFFLIVAFSISNKGSRLAFRRIIYGLLLILFVTSLVQMIIGGFNKDIELLDYFTNSLPDFKGTNRTYGGLLGGVICCLLCPYVGDIAAVCIMSAFIIVFGMLITGKALFTYMKRKSIDYAHERKRLREEQAENYESSTSRIYRRERDTEISEDELFNNTYQSNETKESFIDTLMKRGTGSEVADKHNISKKEADYKKTDFEVEELVPGKSHNTNKTENDRHDETDYAGIEIKRKFAGKTSIDVPVLRRPIRTIQENMNSRFITDLEDDTSYQEHSLSNNSTFYSNDDLFENEEKTESADSGKITDSSDKIINIQSFLSKNDGFIDSSGTARQNEKEEFEQLAEEFSNNQNDSKEDDNETDNSIIGDELTITNRERAARDIIRVAHEVSTDKAKSKPSSGAACFTDMSIPAAKPVKTVRKYVFPSVSLLTKVRNQTGGVTQKELNDTAAKLVKTFESFGVGVSVTDVSCGPTVTRYELHPEQGVKVSRITSLADDIKLSLAAADIRIEAPIPGKSAVGIEVPNKENSPVLLRELIESEAYKKHSSSIAFAVGKDISGQTVVTDIAKMPHLLIAGATGSGKSVCINTLIMSILYKAKPTDVRLIMIDPKVVELNVYNGIPHLLIPVVTDPKKASGALNWAVVEMTDRYKRFADAGVRDLKGYNQKIENEEKDQNIPEESSGKLPQIVIIVDELADLMMVASGDVEDAICRLAQLARAAGIHLVIATQRPTVNVITGQIKANVPSRIAFSVSSALDSRTIIDSAGAEKLLGKGDMLFFPSGYPKPVRLQGAFISDKEVTDVVSFLKDQCKAANYNDEISNHISDLASAGSTSQGDTADNSRDEYFTEAGRFIIDKDKASIGMLQRVYKIGFNRAARIMDQLSEAGVVGPEEGTKPRKILMTLDEFNEICNE